MTGYYLEIGYLSGGHKKVAWQVLKDVVKHFCDNPELIAEEAIAFGLSKDKATEYAQSYKDCQDLTIRIKEQQDEDAPAQIVQYASGYGESRYIKEAMRRAFCRLVLREMHKKEFEINIRVS